jgi:hypothetical protein
VLEIREHGPSSNDCSTGQSHESSRFRGFIVTWKSAKHLVAEFEVLQGSVLLLHLCFAAGCQR